MIIVFYNDIVGTSIFIFFYLKKKASEKLNTYKTLILPFQYWKRVLSGCFQNNKLFGINILTITFWNNLILWVQYGINIWGKRNEIRKVKRQLK